MVVSYRLLIFMSTFYVFFSVLDHRLDYVLEHSMVEYFSAITSHQAYWHSLDFAKFVLYIIHNTVVDNADAVGGEIVEDKMAEDEDSAPSKL